MYKISKKTEYALIILKHMDSRCATELTTAREIESIYGLPFDTCAKVMQQMSNADLLKSIQGVKGGYQITRPLARISFYELVQIIEGQKQLTRCLSGKCDQDATCNITDVVQKLNNYVHEFFHGLSLAELFEINPIHKITMMSNKAEQ